MVPEGFKTNPKFDYVANRDLSFRASELLKHIAGRYNVNNHILGIGGAMADFKELQEMLDELKMRTEHGFDW